MAFPPKAEAIFDIFTVYGKRNNTINEIILEALSTPDNKWQRTRAPIQDRPIAWASYGQLGDSSKSFEYQELHFTNHPKTRTLEDLRKEAEELPKKPCGESTSHFADGTVSRARGFYTTQFFTNTPHSFCHEEVKWRAEQKVKYTSTTNIMGQTTEQYTELEPEVIQNPPLEYSLYMTVDLGQGEFRRYVFKLTKKIPSEEEKTYLTQLFQYMESQIAHVGT